MIKCPRSKFHYSNSAVVLSTTLVESIMAEMNAIPIRPGKAEIRRELLQRHNFGVRNVLHLGTLVIARAIRADELRCF
jgi:hypothetical protein